MIHSYTPPGVEEPLTCGIIESSPHWDRGINRTLSFDNFRILYLLEGRGRVLTEEGDEFLLQKGALLIRRSHWSHRIIRSHPWKEYFVTAPATVENLLTSCGVLKPDQILFQPGFNPSLEKLCREVEFSLMNREKVHRFLGSFFHLLEEFMLCSGESMAGQRQDRIAPAVNMLSDQRYFMYRIPEIAEKCGLTYENFRKLFKREYGISPSEYRIKIRLERARDLLIRKDLSMGEIAVLLHYPDPYSFSRQFRKWTGQSPREYRNSLWL